MRILLMLTLSLIALGCSKKDKPCPYNGNCGSELACEPVTKTCQHICAKSSDCERGFRCNNSESVCFSPKAVEQKREIEKAKRDAEHIRRTCSGCKDNGRCALVNDFCAPATEMHCLESFDCRDHGKCSRGRDKRGVPMCVKK
jgi:hypothetical protein